jgi:N-acetylmuramoyl-L-alanine amidase
MRLNASISPDRNYLAYEIYGSSLFVEVLETGEVRDLGEGNRPVWDVDGRLHFITVIENDDHSEEVIHHVIDLVTGQRSVLPEWAPRPEFVPTPPTPAARAKRMVPSTASVTGLSGWNIFLDQGHSRTENQGLYNYSEAEKVLRIGLHLRQMLLEQTDIDTVFLARTSDTDLVGLTQRTDMANALGANFYYSIHSNAGSPTTNNTLMLWGANGQGVEKIPNGGKKMGDIMIQDLTASMRIPTIGSRADSPFYGATTRTTPYLSVNRNSTMASVLSEGGFHTNPTQQQRNLNAEWKKLEAQSAFWSILRYHGLSRPKVGILTGIVSNVETARPINGAQIRVGDRTYTTDTFESLFSRYSNNPNELANGFYYMESFTPGATLSVEISAPGFYTQTASVSLQDTTFTFLDRGLISSVPPSIAAFTPPGSAGRAHPHPIQPSDAPRQHRSRDYDPPIHADDLPMDG